MAGVSYKANGVMLQAASDKDLVSGLVGDWVIEDQKTNVPAVSIQFASTSVTSRVFIGETTAIGPRHAESFYR